MKSLPLISLIGTALILAACQSTSSPSQPEAVSQTDLSQEVEAAQVESTGNPDTDLNAINQEISDLDPQADFDAFSQTDLTE